MNSGAKRVGTSFKWETSSKGITTGIYMWHKPVLVKQNNGKEVWFMNNNNTISTMS